MSSLSSTNKNNNKYSNKHKSYRILKMDSLSYKVAILVTNIKKATLPAYYNFMQSAKGHNFMRKFGPFVVFMFFATQLLHAFLFYTVFGPAL